MSIPLDPRVGGRCISEDELEIDDIIVSTTAAFSSSFIRLTTSSAVSHSMLYVGGQVVEAIEEGVILRSLSAALSDATLAVAYRKMGLTVNQKLQIRDFAGNQLGLKYSYVNAAGSGLDRSVGHPAPKPDPYLCAKVGICTVDSDPIPIASDSFFCSQLVLSAFAAAGVPLSTTAPVNMTPGDIVDLFLNSVLLYVGHLKAPPLKKSPSPAEAFPTMFAPGR